jgi:hypothetical protein
MKTFTLALCLLVVPALASAQSALPGRVYTAAEVLTRPSYAPTALRFAGYAAAVTLENAQTAFRNPKLAIFTASPDHNATFPDGSFILTSYRMQILDATTNAVVRDTDIGKPTLSGADASVALTNAQLSNNRMYVYTLIAVGPDGASVPASPVSGQFWFGSANPPRPPTNLRLGQTEGVPVVVVAAR